MKKWHSSPLGLSRCTASGRNSGIIGSALTGCDGVDASQSPFRTPPSLSYGCSEVYSSWVLVFCMFSAECGVIVLFHEQQLNGGGTSEGGLEPLGAGQHKKVNYTGSSRYY